MSVFTDLETWAVYHSLTSMNVTALLSFVGPSSKFLSPRVVLGTYPPTKACQLDDELIM